MNEEGGGGPRRQRGNEGNAVVYVGYLHRDTAGSERAESRDGETETDKHTWTDGDLETDRGSEKENEGRKLTDVQTNKLWELGVG